jgi:flagellar biosynthesis GTPase FlhF
MNPEIVTFRARSLAEALRLVRRELGPDAAVLATREVGSPLARLLGGRTIEVTASADADVPSRLPIAATGGHAFRRTNMEADLQDFRERVRRNLRLSACFEDSLVERLASQRAARTSPELC